MSRLQSELGKFRITMDSDDPVLQQKLNGVAEFQPGSSSRFTLEAELYKYLVEKSQLEAAKARVKECELRQRVAS